MMRCLLAAMAVAGAPAATQACAWPVWRLSWGQGSSILLTATSGAPCATPVNAAGAPVAQVRALRRPTHGVLTVNARRVTYQSKPGFVGRDIFLFEVTNPVTTRGRLSRAWVFVQVQVTPPPGESD